MSLHYADTSAWLKLIVDEDETEPMLDLLAAVQADAGTFVSSQLLVTELHQSGRRLGVTIRGIDEALGEIELLMPTAETFRLAGRLPGSVRSLDALHLAGAIEAGATTFVTYDSRQAEAAIDAGLGVISPGA